MRKLWAAIPGKHACVGRRSAALLVPHRACAVSQWWIHNSAHTRAHTLFHSTAASESFVVFGCVVSACLNRWHIFADASVRSCSQQPCDPIAHFSETVELVLNRMCWIDANGRSSKRFFVLWTVVDCRQTSIGFVLFWVVDIEIMICSANIDLLAPLGEMLDMVSSPTVKFFVQPVH